MERSVKVYIVWLRLGKSDGKFLVSLKGTLSATIEDAMIFPTREAAEKELAWLEEEYRTDKLMTVAYVSEFDLDDLFASKEE